MSLLWAGFALGCAFGAAARWGRFCLVRGLRQTLGHDAHEPAGSTPALQAFALALAVALLASQGLQLAEVVDLGQGQIVRPNFSIAGVLGGGVLFGIGMVLANSCGARALVLLAGGNLRALVTLLFLALGAQSTLTGVLSPLRQWLQSFLTTELAHSTHTQALAAAGWSPLSSYLLLAVAPAASLLVYALYRPALRNSPAQWMSATVIGLLVAIGWWITATIEVDPFESAKLTSLSFIAPTAESLLYLQLAVGRELSLGPAIVAGVLFGALTMALWTRTARWEGFDHPSHLAKSAIGGLCMGFGGVLAAGCSVGQGLTGLSTLAWASFPAIAGIVLGSMLCLLLVGQRR